MYEAANVVFVFGFYGNYVSVVTHSHYAVLHLKALSKRIGDVAEELKADIAVLYGLDAAFACAEYGYAHKCTKPILILYSGFKVLESNSILAFSMPSTA